MLQAFGNTNPPDEAVQGRRREESGRARFLVAAREGWWHSSFQQGTHPEESDMDGEQDNPWCGLVELNKFLDLPSEVQEAGGLRCSTFMRGILATDRRLAVIHRERAVPDALGRNEFIHVGGTAEVRRPGFKF